MYTPVGRAARAQEIMAVGGVRRNGAGWYVASQSREHVEYWCNESTCTCEDFRRRGGPCKHQLAVGLYVEANRPKCQHCGSQADVTSRMRWVGGVGHVQYLECRDKVACAARQDAQRARVRA